MELNELKAGVYDIIRQQSILEQRKTQMIQQIQRLEQDQQKAVNKVMEDGKKKKGEKDAV